MARGWESKSVEEQQSIASQPSEGNRSAADRDLTESKRTLELQISQLSQQFEAARHELHREMLARAITDLKQRLAAL